MKILGVIFALHVFLLLLASSSFTLVSWLWGDTSWTWNYFHYSFGSGFGFTYVSDFSLAQVLCYISGYALGVVAMVVAWNRLPVFLSAVATVVCLLGTLSFSIEATHWLWSHHRCWIVSIPGLMVILWIWAGIHLLRHRRKVASDVVSDPQLT